MQIMQPTIDFQAFFVDLLSTLSEREQEVLKKRYQLTSNVEAKHTLKKIGDFYGITRERVRQIEREAIDKLNIAVQHDPYKEPFTSLQDSLTTFMTRKGGVVTESDLIAEYVLKNHSFDFLHLNAFLFVLEYLVDHVFSVKESDDFYAFWQLNKANYQLIEDFINRVVASLEEKGSTLDEITLHDLIQKNVISEVEKEYVNAIVNNHDDVNSNDVVSSLLAITKKVEVNILEQWGLSTWADIKPKKLADKIKLVFLKEKEPLHFRDVAERINNAGFDHKKICAATVHNELIANKLYVLIGRGIYALKEWGYTPGTVTDIIVSVLKGTDRPMDRDAIYQEVLKQRKVNPSTIYLSLINKEKFKKMADGTFGLK